MNSKRIRNGSPSPFPSWLPLTSLIVYRFGNNLGLGPLPWLINGEMFSEEAKGISSSIVTVTHWTSVFFVTRYATNLQVRNKDCTERANGVCPRLRDSAVSSSRNP